MTPYHLEKIDANPVRISGGRAQYPEWAVIQGTKLVAVFAEERTADSYCRRLNSWLRQNQRARA